MLTSIAAMPSNSGRKKDYVWSLYVVLPANNNVGRKGKRVKCKYCNAEVHAQVDRLRQHTRVSALLPHFTHTIAGTFLLILIMHCSIVQRPLNLTNRRSGQSCCGPRQTRMCLGLLQVRCSQLVTRAALLLYLPAATVAEHSERSASSWICQLHVICKCRLMRH